MSGTLPDMDLHMYEIVDLSKQKSKRSSSSKENHSAPSALLLCVEAGHKVLTGNIENTIEKKSSATVSDLYDVVNLSKKKKEGKL